MNPENSVIHTKTADLSLIEQNILYISYRENVTIDLEDSIENNIAGKSLMNQDRMYGVLVDALPFFSFTTEAKEYEMDNEAEKYSRIKAIALLVNHLHIRILARFIMNFHKNNKLVKSKIFSDKEEALVWLRSELDAKIAP